MSATSTVPDFDDFDHTGPQTLPDDQPRGSGSGDEGGDYSKYGDDEIASLEEKTRCRVSFAKPKAWNKNGKGGERIRFTVAEPAHLAGLETTLFLTLSGAPGKVGKGKRDLGDFGRAIGCTDKSVAGILAAIGKASDDAVEIDVDLVPADNGGDPFVNFVDERKSRK